MPGQITSGAGGGITVWVAAQALALLSEKRLDKVKRIESQRLDTRRKAGPSLDFRTWGVKPQSIPTTGSPRKRQVNHLGSFNGPDSMRGRQRDKVNMGFQG